MIRRGHAMRRAKAAACFDDFLDTFTESSDTWIEDHTPDVCGTNYLVSVPQVVKVYGGLGYVKHIGTGSQCVTLQAPGSIQRATVALSNTDGGMYFYIRIDNLSAQNGVLVSWDGAKYIRVRKFVGGTPTDLITSISFTPASPPTFVMESSGTNFKLWADGVLKANVTIPNFSGIYCGPYFPATALSQISEVTMSKTLQGAP